MQGLWAGACRTRRGVAEGEVVCGADHSVRESREESRDTVMWAAGRGDNDFRGSPSVTPCDEQVGVSGCLCRDGAWGCKVFVRDQQP